MRVAMCAIEGARHPCSRALRIASTEETTGPAKESNNFATIIPDMRHVAGYGSG